MNWTGLEKLNVREITPIKTDIQSARSAAHYYTKKTGNVYVAFVNNGRTFIERVK